jgi:energy-coupling factor transport system ATP-binding protein
MSANTMLISLQQASVAYAIGAHGSRQALRSVTLDIQAGEWISVTGSNGSGKSTLASILLGLCPLSSGRLERKADVVIRGVMQQPDAQLIGDTVQEEFDLVLGNQLSNVNNTSSRIEAALAKVRLPLMLNHPVSELSGGQKQLLNLAAALSCEPDILVLDEPTAMLDPAVRELVLEAVRMIHQQGTTIIWITHRLEELTDADRVIAFANGSIAYEGTSRAFFYGTHESSACTNLGLEPPYAVQVTMSLIKKGILLSPLPISLNELAEAVQGQCR